MEPQPEAPEEQKVEEPETNIEETKGEEATIQSSDISDDEDDEADENNANTPWRLAITDLVDAALANDLLDTACPDVD